MKPSELMSLLKVTIPAKLPVLIKSAPGTGKTDIIYQMCDVLNTNLHVEHPVVSDPTDFKGMPYATPDGNATFLPFGNLKKLINTDIPTVCFLDDLGQASVAVQAAAMQLILSRRINGFMVSDQVTFIAATNRHSDRSGVTGILEAVKSRFTTIVELTTDLNDWTKWALSNNVPTDLINFIRFRPEFLQNFKPTNEITNSPSPRTIVHVGKLMNAGIPQTLEYDVFKGAAGEGLAAELVGFLKVCRNIPNPDTILMQPATAPVPDNSQPSELYAICGALARRATEYNAERLITYANRLPDEFSVLLVNDAQALCPKMTNCRAYIDWSIAHNDILS